MTASESNIPGSCQLCGSIAPGQLKRAALVRPVVAQLIAEANGSWDENGWICNDDLQHYRDLHVENILRTELGEITQIEEEVLESLHEHEVLASNPDTEFDSDLSFGQRLADRIAMFGGSWAFILLFALFLALWILGNTLLLTLKPFDPYPFILLNLLLSSLAAIQAPVIMMSQNRQESRDRARATHEYQINLKAELEIRQLHQKIDHLLSHQWQRLVEIQEIQMELIKEVRARQ
ncbi:MAG: DUF1003 domain-containing protein [Thermoanaerobaculia bacterium]|nr:DUF1003 domain-containing protein [Thermoanaerobaculia bacterium]